MCSLCLALPEEGPRITGGRPRYQVGDTVRVNCTSGSSKPAAQLVWFINGEQVGYMCHWTSNYVNMTKNCPQSKEVFTKYRTNPYWLLLYTHTHTHTPMAMNLDRVFNLGLQQCHPTFQLISVVVDFFILY